MKRINVGCGNKMKMLLRVGRAGGRSGREERLPWLRSFTRRAFCVAADGHDQQGH
jgi:hypothetical protein